MILRALVDLYESLERRGEIAPPGWCQERVSYALTLSPEGDLLDLAPVMKQNDKGKDVPQDMLVPHKGVRSSGVKATYLSDNISYFFGTDDKGKPKRSEECFDAAKALHLELLADVDSEPARAVRGYFSRWEPAQAREHPLIEPLFKQLTTANLVFRINGVFAHEDPAIRAAWNRSQAAESELPKARCLVTGEQAAPVLLHGKIKGIQGAQAVGANLVSFNKQNRAYESYGKVDAQGLNAPISEHAAFAYVTALNHLIADRNHIKRLGDTTIVYWAERAEPKPPAVFNAFMAPGPEDGDLLAGVMENLAAGRPIDGVDLNSRFYILGIAPNAARLSVRFFLQDTFGSFLTNLAAHYERLEIVRHPNDTKPYLSVPAMLFETINPNSTSKQSSPLMTGEAIRAILLGLPYPRSLYQAVMIRLRAERGVTRAKAAIIKACLLTQDHPDIDKEALTVALQENVTSPAYVLGRLFRVLERVQLESSPGINATIRDRYFTSAGATPALVFPRLLNLYGSHLKKIRSEKPGLAYYYDNLVGQLLDKIDGIDYPKHLSLNEQGQFSLGYYHQAQSRVNRDNKEEAEDAAN